MVIDAATNQELCRNRLVVYPSVVEPQCCVKRQEKRPISELSSALPGAHLVALLACSEAGHGGQTRRFLRSPRDWRKATGDGRPKSVPWQRKAPEGAPSPPWLRLDAVNHRRGTEETTGKFALGPRELERRIGQSVQTARRTPGSGGGGRARRDKEGAKMERRCRRKGNICKYTGVFVKIINPKLRGYA
jgi:hypothetical protein